MIDSLFFAATIAAIGPHEFDPVLAGVVPSGDQCRLAYERAAKDADELDKVASISEFRRVSTHDVRCEARVIAAWWYAAWSLRCPSTSESTRSECFEIVSRRRWPMPLSWR